eukprot:360894-Chlamydomonas_euryale.AAC.10
MAARRLRRHRPQRRHRGKLAGAWRCAAVAPTLACRRCRAAGAVPKPAAAATTRRRRVAVAGEVPAAACTTRRRILVQVRLTRARAVAVAAAARARARGARLHVAAARATRRRRGCLGERAKHLRVGTRSGGGGGETRFWTGAAAGVKVGASGAG